MGGGRGAVSASIGRRPVANAPSGRAAADLAPAPRPAGVARSHDPHDRQRAPRPGLAVAVAGGLPGGARHVPQSRHRPHGRVPRLRLHVRPDRAAVVGRGVRIPSSSSASASASPRARWVNVGGWWVEPDCNMPMGESFARQGLYGQRYLQSRFGAIADGRHERRPVRPQRDAARRSCAGSGWTPTASCGPVRTRATSTRPLFQWESPDGSRVLAYRIPFEYCSPAGRRRRADREVARAVRSVARRHDGVLRRRQPRRRTDQAQHRVHPPVRPDGHVRKDDDVLTARLLRRAARPRRRASSTACASVATTCSTTRRAAIPSHSGIKAWQRRAQFAAALGRALGRGRHGASRRRSTTRAMTSSGRGSRSCSTSSTTSFRARRSSRRYDDARDQLGEAVAISKRIITRAHNRHRPAGRHPDGCRDTQPVLVFNPHPWPVSVDVDMQYGSQPRGVQVVDHDGTAVLSQATPVHRHHGRHEPGCGDLPRRRARPRLSRSTGCCRAPTAAAASDAAR